MYELVISTRNGVCHSVMVRNWQEASNELASFVRNYSSRHPNDEIWDASVLDRAGDRVARYNRGQIEFFD